MHYFPCRAVQSRAEPIVWEQLHAILRPDEHGKWFIQNDVDHAPHGFGLYVVQDDKQLQIFFKENYKFAGVVQISSDDGFSDVITGHANLGLGVISINIFSNKRKINRKDVWQAIPEMRKISNGNLWVSATMRK